MTWHDVLQLVYAVLGAVLVGIGTLLIRRYLPAVQGKVQVELLRELAKMAVAAAEQLAGQRGWRGQDKRAFAIEVLQESLARLGVQVTPQELEAAVEAAVAALNAHSSAHEEGTS